MRQEYRQKQYFYKPFFFFLLVSALALTACLKDVPHDNPLDPASDKSGFTISGLVQTYYAPYTPLAGVLVWLKPGDYISRSSEDGSFRISNIRAGTYTIYCSADGYRTDSAQVNISAPLTHSFNLDGLPIFVKQAITTHHVARWFPLEDVYYLSVTAQMNDPDGLADLKWVRCEIPFTAYADTLDPDVEAGHFIKIFLPRI